MERKKNVEYNEEILDILENKPIEEEYEDFLKVYHKLERRIKKLKNFGKECKCEDDITIAHLPHEPEMHEYQLIHFCLSCGGYVEW